MENGLGIGKQQTNGVEKSKPYRPATRSTKKINEYFAKLPANGIIRVQNGHASNSSEDSNDSIEDDDDSSEIKLITTENVPPNSENHSMQKLQQMMNGGGPILKAEGQIANANLFLQEPVLKLEFDKNEAVLLNGIGMSTIKTSFLSTEITTKFQTLAATEYINKVLGSHDDDDREFQMSNACSANEDFLLNDTANSLLSPVHGKRLKPTTPHRMILCTSPLKVSSSPSSIPKQTAETIKAARIKYRGKTK